LNEFDRGSTLLHAVRIVLNEFGRGSTSENSFERV